MNKKAPLFKLSLIGFSLTILASHLIAALSHSSANLTSGLIGTGVVGTATVLQFLLASGFMLLSWWSLPEKISKKQITLLLACGVLLRLILIPVDSYSSSDTSRYLFDGKLAYEGFDPYQTAHDAPELEALKAQWAPPEEHAKYVTLYPPVALAFFALSASTGVEMATPSWKLIVTTFSLITLFVGALILKQLNKSRHLPLLALSPLLILESGVGAHLDTLSAAVITLIIWAYLNQRYSITGVFIAFGTAIKLLPLALMMPLVLHHFFNGRIKPCFQIGLSALAALVVIYGMTFWLGFKPIGSIGVFFQKWRFGSPLFSSLESLFPTSSLLVILAALFIIGLLLVSLKLFIQRQDNSHQALLDSSQYILALPLFSSPVLFPWYLMPLMVLTALQPNLIILSWITLAPLTYEVLDQFLCCNQWQPAVWPLWAMLTGVIVAALIKISLFFSQRRTTRGNI